MNVANFEIFNVFIIVVDPSNVVLPNKFVFVDINKVLLIIPALKLLKPDTFNKLKHVVFWRDVLPRILSELLINKLL